MRKKITKSVGKTGRITDSGLEEYIQLVVVVCEVWWATNYSIVTTEVPARILLTQLVSSGFFLYSLSLSYHSVHV